MGISDRVTLRHIAPERDGAPMLIATFYTGTLVWDILNQLAAYHRPYENEPGEVDRIYQGYCDELIHLLETPPKPGFTGVRESLFGSAALDQLVRRASAEFAALRKRRQDKKSLRTIFLTGDIYLRLDEFCSEKQPHPAAECPRYAGDLWSRCGSGRIPGMGRSAGAVQSTAGNH
jgi:hypothetical protein